MKRFLICLGLVIFSVSAWGDKSPKPEEWTAQATEVEEWSRTARDQYEDGKSAELSGTLEKVRVRVDEVVRQAEGETRKEFEALSREAKELKKLTGKKTRQGMRRLEKFFARLHNAIARKKMLEASRAWGDKQTDRAKSLLDDIHAHVKQAAQQTDRKVKASTRELLHNLKQISERLEHGGKKLGEEFGRVFSQLTRETERLREQSAK